MGSASAALCIFILSWNVASQSPADQSLRELLTSDSSSFASCPNGLPDIYVIGLQKVNLILVNSWQNKLTNLLKRSNHERVKSSHTNGLYTMVFAHKNISYLINNVEALYTNTGGLLAKSKGANSIRLDLNNSSFSFVNSHLVSHEKEEKQRLKNYKIIMRRHVYKAYNTRRVFDHDVVFWLGGFNFHVDLKLQNAKMLQKLSKNELDQYLQSDQLVRLLRAGKSFEKVSSESKPNIPSNLGTIDNDLKELPTWSDRILVYSKASRYIEINTIAYSPQSSLELESMHKPVTGLYVVQITPAGQRVGRESYAEKIAQHKLKYREHPKSEEAMRKSPKKIKFKDKRSLSFTIMDGLSRFRMLLRKYIS